MHAVPNAVTSTIDVLGIAGTTSGSITGNQLRTHLVDTLGEDGRNRADYLGLPVTEDGASSFMPVTLWARKNVNGDFRFNHLEDGHISHGVLTPTPKVPAQKVAWGKSTWEYEHAWLDASSPPRVVHAVVKHVPAQDVDDDSLGMMHGAEGP